MKFTSDKFSKVSTNREAKDSLDWDSVNSSFERNFNAVLSSSSDPYIILRWPDSLSTAFNLQSSTKHKKGSTWQEQYKNFWGNRNIYGPMTVQNETIKYKDILVLVNDDIYVQSYIQPCEGEEIES